MLPFFVKCGVCCHNRYFISAFYKYNDYIRCFLMFYQNVMITLGVFLCFL